MSSVDVDIEKYKICKQLMDEGDYLKALSISETISTPGYRASVLIDAGFAVGKSGIVKQGTKLFEELISSDEGTNFDRSSILYNIANGYCSLYELKRNRRKVVVPPNDDYFRAAKRNYREAIKELPSRKGAFTSQVWVNYGNCLSLTGRYIEAIECYQNGLDADSTNGMAAGNLGIELERVSRITGNYRHEYLALAHDLLSRALGSSMHLKYGSKQAIQSFQMHKDHIKYFLDAHKEPIPIPQLIKPRGKSREKKEYIQFCIDNGLFLNAWVGDKHLTPGITDEISFGPIITDVGDQYLVPELLRILNEIKEAFATARYLYFLSKRKNILLDDISVDTLYFNFTDFNVYGIYTGLCKTAYTRAFDILDKVAKIILVYFGIGRRIDDFWNILVEKQSIGEKHVLRYGVRPMIAHAGNLSLYALADICIDFFEGEQIDLKNIDIRRNKITHDYLSICDFPHKIENVESITTDELSRSMLNILRLAKYAILYAVGAVNLAEHQKKAPRKVITIPYKGYLGEENLFDL